MRNAPQRSDRRIPVREMLLLIGFLLLVVAGVVTVVVPETEEKLGDQAATPSESQGPTESKKPTEQR